eukprot:EG_transcript_8265
MEKKSLKSRINEGEKMLKEKSQEKMDFVTVVRTVMSQSKLSSCQEENLFGRQGRRSPKVLVDPVRGSPTKAAGGPQALPPLPGSPLKAGSPAAPTRAAERERPPSRALDPLVLFDVPPSRARLTAGKVSYKKLLDQQSLEHEIAAASDRKYRAMLEQFFTLEDRAWGKLDALTRELPEEGRPCSRLGATDLLR